jgi:hypothetical protein
LGGYRLAPIFGQKYSEGEKNALSIIENAMMLGQGTGENKAKNVAKKIVVESIKQAQAEGLRGKKDLGDELIRDNERLKQRLKTGLTINDIKDFLNQDYVLQIALSKYANMLRLGFCSILVKRDHMEVQQAIREVRRTLVYWGEPEDNHKNYQGEDGNIPWEFMPRYEKWREAIEPSKEQEMASQFSTYNAMVRDLIRRKII